MNGYHPIPGYTGLAIQIDRENVLVNAEAAVMSQKDFLDLSEYTTTNPTAVHPGRMWKTQIGHEWFLRWYGYAEMRGGCEVCFVHQRPITILDWKSLLGATS